MDELKKKIHQMELENESLPEKVCVQLASEIEHQLLPTDGLWEIDQGVGRTHCKGIIKDLVRRHRHEHAVSIAEVIKRKAGECCRGLSAEDDMTLITVKFDADSKC